MKYRPSACSRRRRLGFVGHVAADRLVDQPVELDRVRSGARSAPRAGPQTTRRLGEEEGLLGDPPAPATAADHPSMHSLPHPGQAVAQLEGVADVPLPRIRRHPQRRGELGDRELRHPRRTLTRDRHPRLAIRTGREGLGLQDRIDRVHRRPVHRRAQQTGLRRGRRSARSVTRGGQHRGSGVGLGRGLDHGSTQAPTTDTPRPRTPWLSGSVETDHFSRNRSRGRCRQRSS